MLQNSQNTEEKDHLNLSELTSFIKEIFEINFVENVTVVAEIAELKVASSGHCYLDLIEKKNDKIVARTRATIWSFQYERIANQFFNVTGQTLKSGIKVMLSCQITFHELYGVAINVKGIDPSYTLGDQDKKRREILERLKKEQLLDKNSLTELELLPKRIAIISSSKAAGFEDFENQLKINVNSYVFETFLFEATMQGDKVGDSIINALSEIDVLKFDCVVIIRGGGATMDLVGFDDYELAKAIANFSLPVITGIGHERDHTIIDEVAHTKIKTPTAVAEFLISKFNDFEDYLGGVEEGLIFLTNQRISRENRSLVRLGTRLGTANRNLINEFSNSLHKLGFQIQNKSLGKINDSKQQIERVVAHVKSNLHFNAKEKHNKLSMLSKELESNFDNSILSSKNKINLIENTLKLVDPINVINRGYALVYKDDKIETSSKSLSEEDEICIKMKDGIVKSKVQKNGKKN